MILKRHENWPAVRHSTVQRIWEGRTVVCAATGPTLTAEQCETARASGAPVIAVNDAYLLAPFAEVCYFADLKWWGWHKDRPEFKAFAGAKCSIDVGACPADVNVHMLKRCEGKALSSDPGEISTGSNSGYQALNIACLSGARRVVLIGYDARIADGKQHFFGQHPDKSYPPFEVIRQRFREAADAAKKLGIEILNASPGSVVDAFPAVDLAASLQPDPHRAVLPA